MTAVSLSTIRNRVAKRASETIGASTRHTTTEVNSLINESLEEYYLLLTDNGHPQRVTRDTATTTASTSVSNGWPANEFVALPTDFMSLLAAVLVLSDGQEVPMVPFTENEYGEWLGQFAYAGFAGAPVKFRIANGADGAKILRLLPRSDAAYTIKIVYVPLVTALSGDSDTFDFFPGGAEWVVCDVALKILEGNNLPEQMGPIAARKAQAEQRLLRFARRQNRAGPVGMRDTRTLGMASYLIAQRRL